MTERMTPSAEQVAELLEDCRVMAMPAGLFGRIRDLLEALQAENERLRGALRLYANPENWENDSVDIGVGNLPVPDSSYCAHDAGDTARAALAGDAQASAPPGASGDKP